MDELSKVKHSKRIQQKENHVKKQVKIAKANGIPVKQGEEHYLAKHSAVNCGNPTCILCMNPRKSMGEKTIQEKKFEQDKLWVDDGKIE